MQHAVPRRSWLRRPLVLPALLVTAVSGAFAGLATVPSAAAPQVDRLIATGAVAPDPLVPADRDLRPASRSRTRVLPAPEPTPPAPQPVVKVVPPAPPKPKPVVKRKARVRAPAKPAVVAAAPPDSGGLCPVPSASFTDTYGAARSGGRSHQGTDLLADYGAPVYAVADGVVDTASSSNGGISLYLRAGNGERYFYAHNSENVAGDGQQVSAGELIARVGSTGNAGSINHVHFEREVGGSSVNPYRFLRGIC